MFFLDNDNINIFPYNAFPHTNSSLIVDSDEATGGIGRKDSATIQYDSISQTGSMQSMMSSDNDNDDNTENDAKDEQQDVPSHDTKSKVKMHTFNDHLKSQDFQVCVTIIEARQLPGYVFVHEKLIKRLLFCHQH